MSTTYLEKAGQHGAKLRNRHIRPCGASAVRLLRACCGGDDFEAADLPLQASAHGPADDKIVIVAAVEDDPVTQVA
jgi:hypothetical protein